MPDDGRSAAPQGKGAALLRHYEAIAQASRAMLVAARADDWEEVARLEGRCRALIVELTAAAATAALSRSEQRHRVQLLRDILADDAEIRTRSEPWLRQLEQMFDSRRRVPRGTG